jgi:hypothetical protein
MARRALCVGINNYPGTEADLAGCVNDARDWSEVLASHKFQVTTLLDRRASRKGMLDAIADLVSQARSGETVVFTYSGHGSYVPDADGDEPDGTDECLCPWDIDDAGPITDDELHDVYTSKASGVKLVVISDSCHSGTVAKWNPISTPPTTAGGKAPQRKVRFLPPQTFLSQRDAAALGLTRATRASSPPGRHSALLMAGCQDHEYSYDAYFKGRPNGAFTFVALMVLGKLKKNATYQDWHEAIGSVLPSQQYPQQPNLFGTRTMKKWKVLA